ncbi:MAG: hypothetical protein J2P41_03575 [Blastocatellia bacterium]|nr:hypothetical protein [Blastocatellia bacterium]
MKSRDLIFVIIVITVVGALYFLSTKNKAMPMSTTTPEHFTAKTRAECFKCHLPDTLAALELQHKHPGKWRDEHVSCLQCHHVPQAAKAERANGTPVFVVSSNLESRK